MKCRQTNAEGVFRRSVSFGRELVYKKENAPTPKSRGVRGEYSALNIQFLHKCFLEHCRKVDIGTF